MTKFVMRGGRPVSVERAAILDGLAEGEVPQPAVPAPVVRQESAPPRTRSERLVADVESGARLSPQQKRAATMAANKAARLAAAAEPLRPQNIDPATGEVVVLKEVIEGGEVKQVRVGGNDEAAGEAAEAEPTETSPNTSEGSDESSSDDEDPFDAAVEAAAGADAAASAGESADAGTEAALADA